MSTAPSSLPPSGSDPTSRPPSVAFAQPALADLPHLPCDSEGPVFAEPWQAQAFAMTLALHQRGVFTWPEWAQYLSNAIRKAQAEGDPDTGDTYYQHWLAALEQLLLDKGLAQPLVMTSLRNAWRIAAETTPHGQPIALGAAALRRAGLGPS
jgi:nitrile hydratase accessory protein